MGSNKFNKQTNKKTESPNEKEAAGKKVVTEKTGERGILFPSLRSGVR